MDHIYLTKIATILLGTLMLASSCKTNRLPQVEYANNADDYYIYSILSYQDGKLMAKDSVIEDFLKFHFNCIENSPESDNTSNRLHALAIDKKTPYHEIDSVFRVFASIRNYRIFLLVNDIIDTVGFKMSIPANNIELSKYCPDTLLVDNLIEFKGNAVYINGKKAESMGIDYHIKEMVFKKEQVALAVSKSTQYESFIEIQSIYHKYRQHFKELYSELIFNKEYSWFYELPIYYSELKQQVDEEYRSKIGLFDPEELINVTIIVNDSYMLDYAP